MSYDLFGAYFEKTGTEEEETDTLPTKKNAPEKSKAPTPGKSTKARR
jgi:hypothetical protein